MSGDKKSIIHLTCWHCGSKNEYQIGLTSPCSNGCGWKVTIRSGEGFGGTWSEIVPELTAPTPDDTAAPAFPPYTYGARLRNPYYQARREVWMMSGGMQVMKMIHSKADVTDVLQAFGIAEDLGIPAIAYQLGEVTAKILRLGRKPGTDVRHEFIKMHEHIQAAEDAWVADQEGEK